MDLLEELIKLAKHRDFVSRFTLDAVWLGLNHKMLEYSASLLAPDGNRAVLGQGSVHIESLIGFNSDDLLQLIMHCVNQDKGEYSPSTLVATWDPASGR